MPTHVTGTGSFFFHAKARRALAKWYFEHLGINDPDHGWTWQQKAGPTVFPPFKRDAHIPRAHL